MIDFGKYNDQKKNDSSARKLIKSWNRSPAKEAAEEALGLGNLQKEQGRSNGEPSSTRNSMPKETQMQPITTAFCATSMAKLQTQFLRRIIDSYCFQRDHLMRIERVTTALERTWSDRLYIKCIAEVGIRF